MAYTAKQLSERARAENNPRLRAAHRRCGKCSLYFWTKVFKRHVKACDGSRA